MFVRILDKIILFGLITFALFSAISISIQQIGIFLALIIWIIKLIFTKDRKYTKTSLDIPLLCFIAATFLSAFFGMDVKNSLEGIFKTVGLMSIYFLVVNTVKDKKQAEMLCYVLVLSAIAESAFSLTSYFTGVPSILVEGRLKGTCSHPIFLGEIISIIMVFAICSVVFKKHIIFSVIAIILMGITLLFTYSRGAWLALFISIIFIGIMKDKKVLFVPVIAVLLISTYCFVFPQDKFTKRVKSIGMVDYGSNIERIKMLKSGVKIMLDYPLGVGVHNLDKVYVKYKDVNMENQSHLHNNFMQIAVERGILGLITFCWWIFVFLKTGVKSYFKADNDASKYLILACLSGFIVFLISGLTEYNFGTSRVIMLAWFVMGICNAIL